MDGVLTTEEMADLLEVADVLDLSSATIARTLQAPVRPVAGNPGAVRPVSGNPAAGRPGAVPPTFSLAPGDLIVLTGDMTRPRVEWERDLAHRGFTPWPAVTKKVRLVVAADPDTLSGKARKARDYGIPVVSESGLARLLSERLSADQSSATDSRYGSRSNVPVAMPIITLINSAIETPSSVEQPATVATMRAG